MEEFIDVLCNDWRQSDNQGLKDRIFTSAEKQIRDYQNIKDEYKSSIISFGNKQEKRANNYLQRLKREINPFNENNRNLMSDISDICHGHILIKLKITHGKVRLIDEFMWNINDIDNCNNNYIEQFAHSLCGDQGLPFKFAPSIAINIREQIQKHKERMTKCIKTQNMNSLNELNDPLLHESLRYVGRKEETDLNNLAMWEPTILVHKPPNRAKTKVRE